MPKHELKKRLAAQKHFQGPAAAAGGRRAPRRREEVQEGGGQAEAAP